MRWHHGTWTTVPRPPGYCLSLPQGLPPYRAVPCCWFTSQLPCGISLSQRKTNTRTTGDIQIPSRQTVCRGKCIMMIYNIFNTSLVNPMIPDFCFQDELQTTSTQRMVSGSTINSLLFSPLGMWLLLLMFTHKCGVSVYIPVRPASWHGSLFCIFDNRGFCCILWNLHVEVGTYRCMQMKGG